MATTAPKGGRQTDLAAENQRRRARVAHLEASERELVEARAREAELLIENGHLRAELSEASSERAAVADVLDAIRRSTADPQAVLTAIVERAARLCDAALCTIVLVEGDRLRVGARYPAGASGRNESSWALDSRTPSGRAVLERAVVHLADTPAETWLAEWSRESHRRMGTGTMMTVPLLSGGAVVATFSLHRKEVKPFTERQIALVQTFADQAVIAIENARLFSELRERDERRRQELERASAIQQRLLPEGVQGWPGALEVAVRFRPAVETSGDFFDVLRLSPSTEGALPPLQIAVGDVAGKGMAAALVTALARSALTSAAFLPSTSAFPSGTLRLAGQRLHRDVGSAHFVACALAVVEPPGRHHAGPRLRLANAAQVPVLLVRAGMAREVEPAGYRLPLGTEDDGDYQDAVADLRSGDVVVFSSDGLVEAPSLPTAAAPGHLPPPEKASELFGFARLTASAAHWSACTGTAEDVAAGIWSDLTAWCGHASHHDDVTLLVLRVPG